MIIGFKQSVRLGNMLVVKGGSFACEEDSSFSFTSREEYGFEDFTFTWKDLSFRTFQDKVFKQTNFLDEQQSPLLTQGFVLLRKVIEKLLTTV